MIWSEYASNSFIDKPWYENTGKKSDGNIFGKVNYKISDLVNIYADLQFRTIDYKIEGTHDDLRDLTQSHQYNFFNPKGGIFLTLNDHNNVYASVAVANREPSRSVYRDADPGQQISPERLIDYELGYQFRQRIVLACRQIGRQVLTPGELRHIEFQINIFGIIMRIALKF